MRKSVPLLYVAAFAMLAGTTIEPSLAREPDVEWGQVRGQGGGKLTRGQQATDRPRGELDALGIRAGSFLIFPKLEVVERFDDNIFATERDADADFITDIIPSVEVESDWTNHFLKLGAQADIGRYAFNSGEDYEDAGFNAQGRLDILRSTYVYGEGAYTIQHEDRGDPDDVAGAEPTEFDTYEILLGGYHEFNRLNFTIEGATRNLDFDDADASAGGVPFTINNDDRDRDVYGASGRVGYQIQDQYEAFVWGGYNTTDYDDAVDDQGVNRDSDGYEVRLGTAIDLTGLVIGELFVGYLEKDFDQSDQSDIEGVVGGINLFWSPTELTGVDLQFTRGAGETTVLNSSGTLSETVAVSVDHELLRNILLNFRSTYNHSEFKGSGRQDDTITAGVGVEYDINRNFFVHTRYQWLFRESSADNADYLQNVVLVRLGAQI